MVNVGKPADRGEVFGGVLEDEVELLLCFDELVQLDERAAKRDARGKLPRMHREAGAAHFDRLLVLSRAAQFLGELREGD